MLQKIHEACPTKPWRSGGFTFIELIVVVAILMVLSLGVIVNYNSYTDREHVRQSGLTLKSDLRLTLSKVNSGVKYETCQTLESYDISFSTSSYTITPRCSNGVDASTTVNLPKDVTFQPVPSTIRLLPLSVGTDLLADTIITLTGISSTYTITISPSGTISND